MYYICTNFLKLCKVKSFFEMNQEKCTNYLLLCTSLIQLYLFTVGLLPQTDVAIVFCSGFRLHETFCARVLIPQRKREKAVRCFLRFMVLKQKCHPEHSAQNDTYIQLYCSTIMQLS